MADANAVALQTAINRYAKPAGFVKVAVDGIVGNETLVGARRALEHLTITVDDTAEMQASAVEIQASAFLATTASSKTALATNASALAGFLNYYANVLGYPVVAPPNVTVTSAVATGKGIVESALPLVPRQSAAASFIESWRRLPIWQKVGIGILFGISIMFVRQRLQER